MWINGAVAVFLVGVAFGHPHHHHHDSRSQDVHGHDWTPPPPPVCPPKSLACCDIPPLIDDASLKEAGFEGLLVPPPPPPPHHGSPPPHGPPPHHRDGPHPVHRPSSRYGPPRHDGEQSDRHERQHDHHHFLCEKEKCMFTKLNWSSDNTSLNTESLTTYLSEWASSHEDWSSAKDQVLQNCLNPEEDEDAPPGMCVEIKTIFCLTETLLQNCPPSAWKDSDRCKSLKKASECHDRKYRPPLHLLEECCSLPNVVEKAKLSECNKDSLLPPPPPHHRNHGPTSLNRGGPPPQYHHGPPPQNQGGPPSPNHHGPPPGHDHHDHPPPHHDELLRDGPNGHDPALGGSRSSPFSVDSRDHGPDCNHHWALFEKYGWLTENRTLKSEAYIEHLNTWSTQHQTWGDVKDKVLEICVQDEPLAHMCLPHRILICTQRVLADNCPESSWKSTKLCAGGPQTSTSRPEQDPSKPNPSGIVSDADLSITDPSNKDQEEHITEANTEVIEEDPDSQVENFNVSEV